MSLAARRVGGLSRQGAPCGGGRRRAEQGGPQEGRRGRVCVCWRRRAVVAGQRQARRLSEDGGWAEEKGTGLVVNIVVGPSCGFHARGGERGFTFSRQWTVVSRVSDTHTRAGKEAVALSPPLFHSRSHLKSSPRLTAFAAAAAAAAAGRRTTARPTKRRHDARTSRSARTNRGGARDGTCESGAEEGGPFAAYCLRLQREGAFSSRGAISRGGVMRRVCSSLLCVTRRHATGSYRRRVRIAARVGLRRAFARADRRV